jgi:hypothetical protein
MCLWLGKMTNRKLRTPVLLMRMCVLAYTRAFLRM